MTTTACECCGEAKRTVVQSVKGRPGAVDRAGNLHPGSDVTVYLYNDCYQEAANFGSPAQVWLAKRLSK